MRAAIEEMAEEGEAYTGVFTQVGHSHNWQVRQPGPQVKRIHSFVEKNTNYSKKDVR